MVKITISYNVSGLCEVRSIWANEVSRKAGVRRRGFPLLHKFIARNRVRQTQVIIHHDKVELNSIRWATYKGVRQPTIPVCYLSWEQTTLLVNLIPQFENHIL